MEIVTVIAIIAAIASIAVPAYRAIKQSAQKIECVSKLKKIATAFKTYTFDLGYGRMPPGISGGHVAMLLAGGSIHNGNPVRKDACLINDPHVYIVSGDKYASPIQYTTIGKWSANEMWYWAGPFKPIPNSACGNNAEVLSFCMICPVEPNNHPETTPIAFTRGLCEDGYWDEETGVYGSKGGWILYADGHIKWHDGNKAVSFLKWSGDGYTNNVRETAPNSARFLATETKLVDRAYTSSKGSLVLLYQEGLGGN
jgi:hypothetical protein